MRCFAGIKTKTIYLLSIIALFSSSAFSQAGITFPGSYPVSRFVHKDSIFLFICAGNSAMSGRDPTPDLVTDPHLWKFEMSPANYDWLPAKEPICVDGPNTLTSPKGGPTMPFLKRLAALYPNYYFGVMQLSYSGGTLQGHFNPGNGDINKLLTQANFLKPNLTIAAFVSMLNLVEVQNIDTLNYLQHVVAMVSNVRTQLGLPNLPYIHAGYPVNAGSDPTGVKYDTSLAQAKSIMRQIAQIPGSIANSCVIPTEGLSICFTCAPANYFSHYDHAGNLGWGNRTGDTVLARGWVPLTTSISANPQRRVSSVSVPGFQKVLFDGGNWSVFDKAGKSLSVYSPDGRKIAGASFAAMRNLKLLPGVYFVKPQSQ
jgi:hypothetical protein